MKKPLWIRAVSWLLSIVLIAGMLPVGVLAGDRSGSAGQEGD